MALNDPLNASDLILNGMGGMAINIVTDMYEASAMKAIPDRLYRHPASADVNKVSQDFADKFRKSLNLDTLESNALTRQSHARPFTNAVRNKINTSKWAPKFLKQTAESRREGALLEARQKATRRAINNGTMGKLAGEAKTIGDKTLINKVLAANKVRGLGIMAIGIMGANMAAGVVSGAVRSMVDKGYASTSSNTGFSSSVFLDNQMAYTTRQRALRAIQNSQSGLRRASGQEANYLHQYR